MRESTAYSPYYLINEIDNNPDAKTCLEQLGNSHNKLTIKDGLYDHWLNSLVTTVNNYDGRMYPNIGDIWREVLAPGLELMKQHTGTVKLKAIS